MNKVSIIVPCFNEQARIEQLLEAIHGQSYPLEDIEVIIADGLSTDQTLSIINDYQADHPGLRINVVDNPPRNIPSGLNRALDAAQGEYIIRMDAHSLPGKDYVKSCIEGLEKRLGDNVGGIWKIEPGSTTWIARSIALAVSHPLGAGDALYRIGGTAQAVDTVPFGAFHRTLIAKIGKYDERLLSNEDYEFNTRVRLSGGRVWMDPSIQSTYFARSSLGELSRQYWRYGYWKAQMLRRYPKTLRLRQLIPPLFVLTLIILAFLSIGWILARWILTSIVLLYILALFVAGLQMSFKHKDKAAVLGLPLAIATIHFSWGSALLWGLLSKPPTIGSR